MHVKKYVPYGFSMGLSLRAIAYLVTGPFKLAVSVLLNTKFMADTTKIAPGSVDGFVVGICNDQNPLCLLGKHSVKFSYQLSAFLQNPLP